MNATSQIDQEAQGWARQLPDPSSAEWATFVAWLSRGPEYVRAFHRALLLTVSDSTSGSALVAVAMSAHLPEIVSGLQFWRYVTFGGWFAVFALGVVFATKPHTVPLDFTALVLQWLPDVIPVLLLSASVALFPARLYGKYRRMVEIARAVNAAFASGDAMNIATTIYRVLGVRRNVPLEKGTVTEALARRAAKK